MQGTVKYSEEFIKPDGCKAWFSHEKQYDQDTQDPPFDELVRTVKSEVKKQADSYTLSISDPSRILVPDIHVEKEPEIGITVDQILSCNDLTVLDACYKYPTKGKLELERAYLLRRDQLTQKQ